MANPTCLGAARGAPIADVNVGIELVSRTDGGMARWAAEPATASAAGAPDRRARGNGATRAVAEARPHT